MTDQGSVPEAIQWSEGMMLTPHHFQQATLRQEEVLRYHLAHVAPFHFGVRRLRIDQASLAVGKFRITAIEAVMPDGLIVAHPTDDGEALEVDLTPMVDEMREEPVGVHLVVPAYRPGSALSTNKLARFRSVSGRPVVDENTGDNEHALPRLRPRLAMLVTNQVPQKYISLPIARVTYRNEAIEVTPYIAPPLALTLDSPLGESCRHLVRRLREKAAYLVDRLRSPSGALRAPAVMETRYAIQCLVAALPPFEAVLNTKNSHPFAVYQALTAVAGHVALLGPGMVPPQFDPYDHLDVRRSFDQVLTFAERMIDTISERHVAIAFSLEGNSFRLLLDPAWVRGDLLIGVRARHGGSESDLAAWVGEALIGDAEKVGSLWERRMRGAGRTQVERDDDLEVMPTRGTLLYRVAADPGVIEAGRVLEILNPSDRAGTRRPAEIVLFVPAPAARQDEAADDVTDGVSRPLRSEGGEDGQ